MITCIFGVPVETQCEPVTAVDLPGPDIAPPVRGFAPVVDFFRAPILPQQTSDPLKDQIQTGSKKCINRENKFMLIERKLKNVHTEEGGGGKYIAGTVRGPCTPFKGRQYTSLA